MPELSEEQKPSRTVQSALRVQRVSVLSGEGINFLAPKLRLDQPPDLVQPVIPGLPQSGSDPVRVESDVAPPVAPVLENPARTGPRPDLQRGLALFGLSWEEAVSLGVWVADRARERARRGSDDPFLPDDEPEG